MASTGRRQDLGFSSVKDKYEELFSAQISGTGLCISKAVYIPSNSDQILTERASCIMCDNVEDKHGWTDGVILRLHLVKMGPESVRSLHVRALSDFLLCEMDRRPTSPSTSVMVPQANGSVLHEAFEQCKSV